MQHPWLPGSRDSHGAQGAGQEFGPGLESDPGAVVMADQQDGDVEI